MAVGVGVLAREILRDSLDIGEGSGEGDPGPQARNTEEIMAATVLFAATGGAFGGPKVRGLSGGEVEIPGEHSDDSVRVSIEVDHLADYVLASTESALPSPIAKQDGTWDGGLVFFIMEVPAEDRGNAESMEEARAYTCAVRLLHAGGRLQHKAVRRVNVKRLKDGVLLLPVEVVEIGEVETGAQRDAFKDDD